MRKQLGACAVGLTMLFQASGAQAAAPSVADLARFSAEAYAFTRDPSWRAPHGTTVVHQVKRSSTSGFQAIALLRESDGTLVIAYTGTKANEHDRMDFAADRALVDLALHPDLIAKYRQAAVDVNARGGGVDVRSERYGFEVVAAKVREAQAFFDEALARAQKHRSGFARSHVSVTGHSVGGFLAEVVGATQRIETHTFDAEPGAKLVLARAAASHVTAHYRQYDAKGTPAAIRGAHVGRFCTYPAPDPARAVGRREDAHSIDAFARDLAAGLRATSCD
jgi:hypothetical protein